MRLNNSQVLVLKNQLNSQKLKTLTEKEFHNTLLDLLKEIMILNGAILYPMGSKELSAQINSLKLFLASSWRFMNLTTQEVRQAFYLNLQGELAETHKHFNRPIDAEFVGGVLSSFLKYKQRINDLVPDILFLAREKKRQVFTITDELMMDMIQGDYELYRANRQEEIYNTTSKYIFLRKISAIQLSSKEKWHKWLHRAIEYRIMRLSVGTASKAERQEKNRLLDAYDEYLTDQLIPKAEFRVIAQLARRLIYFCFFEILKSTAIARVFDVEYKWKYPQCRIINQNIHYYG